MFNLSSIDLNYNQNGTSDLLMVWNIFDSYNPSDTVLSKIVIPYYEHTYVNYSKECMNMYKKQRSNGEKTYYLYDRKKISAS